MPIVDAAARATFFLVTLRDAASRVTEIVDWVDR